MSWRKEVEELALRRKWAEECGGPEAVAKHHAAGMLTIRERIDRLFDPRSFREVGKLAGRATYDADGNVKKVVPLGYVAGIGRMQYSRFVFYAFAGCIFWIGFFVYCGFYFGNIPFVKKNLTLFILAIILISIAPGIIAYLRARLRRGSLEPAVRPLGYRAPSSIHRTEGRPARRSDPVRSRGGKITWPSAPAR